MALQVMSVWPFRSLILRGRRSTLPSEAPPGAAPTDYLFSFGSADSLCRDLGMTNRLSGCATALQDCLACNRVEQSLLGVRHGAARSRNRKAQESICTAAMPGKAHRPSHPDGCSAIAVSTPAVCGSVVLVHGE